MQSLVINNELQNVAYQSMKKVYNETYDYLFCMYS